MDQEKVTKEQEKVPNRGKVTNLVVAAWKRLKAFVVWVLNVSKMLEPLVVIVSVVLIGYQLWQQTQLTRAANTQSLVELVLPLNMQLAGDDKMTNLWIRGARGFDDGAKITNEEIEADRYDTILASFLIFHENVYLQHDKGLLDDDIYTAWDKDLEVSIVRGQRLEKQWDERRSSYHPKFVQHVDELIRKARTTPTP
jgi:hypothetical protein